MLEDFRKTSENRETKVCQDKMEYAAVQIH